MPGYGRRSRSRDRSRTPPRHRRDRGDRSDRNDRNDRSDRDHRSSRRERSRSPKVELPKPNPELIKQLLAQQQAGANPAVTRQSRRVYVGNLPIGQNLNEQVLIQFFTNHAVGIGITTPNPIVSVWTSTEGTFCFVECRAVQDASRCVDGWNNLIIGGRNLRVGRPADYSPPPENLHMYVMDIAGLPPAPPGCSGRLLASSTSAPPAPLMGAGTANGSALGPQVTVAPPTPVLLLTNMTCRDDLLESEEYEDILLDIRDECEKFGTVQEVWIPKPNKDDSTKDEPGVGKIFVLFGDLTQSIAAREVLRKRTFIGRPVGATFFPFSKFTEKQVE